MSLPRKRHQSKQIDKAQYKVSVVIASYNEGKYLRRTVNSILRGLPQASEIIVVDDGSTDGSSETLRNGYRRVQVLRPMERLGTVKARNYGASHANGKIIVFSDAHVEVPYDWVRPFLAPLARPEVGAVGPVISMLRQRRAKGYGLRFCDDALNCEWGDLQGPDPYPVPLLGAGFMAMRRELFESIGGFDPDMLMYGMEDPDLDMRLWTFGYQCLLVPSVEVAHLFRWDHPFQDYETFLHNVLRFGFIHFGNERFRRLIESYSKDDYFPPACSRLVSSNVWSRRREIQAARCYDDDWYFQQFPLNSAKAND